MVRNNIYLTSKEQSLQLWERMRTLYKGIKMYWVIYPSIFSLFRQRGRYVCIKRNHCPHFAGVIVPTFGCNACSRCWVWWCPSAIPCRLASSRLFICCCISGRLISVLMAALSALILFSTVLRNGLYDGSFLSSVFCPGSAGLWWAGAPSYIKMMFSSGSRFSLVWAKTSLNLCVFIPPIIAEWNTRPLVGEIASATVTLRPLYPDTCLYALSLILALPWFLAVHIL